MQMTIGVMGSAEGEFAPDVLTRLERLGEAIAKQNCTLITGGCPGLSYAAVRGAKAAGGLVVGVSPALSAGEHVGRYASPLEGFDLMVYSGSGLMGREILNIRSSDVVIIAGGRSGTLGEFSIAYDEGRLIGVLRGTGGVAGAVEDLVQLCNKDTGAVVLYDEDPERLVDRLLDYYKTEHYKRPNCFCDGREGQPAG